MREEIVRIMRLVEQGKIKPEDAAELIDALGYIENGSVHTEHESTSVNGEAAHIPETPEPPIQDEPPIPPSNPETGHNTGKESFANLFESIEKATRATVERIDVKKLAEDIRTQTKRGVEEMHKAIEQMGKSEFWAKVNAKTGSVIEKHQELTFPLEAGKRLRIENPLGDIFVTGGADMAQVDASVEIRAFLKETAEEKSRSWAIIVEEDSEGCIVRSPAANSSFNSSADLHVRIPDGVRLEIRSVSGDVNVLDTHAPVDIDNTNGDVNIREASGHVRLHVTRGDVRLENTKAERIHIETQSGDIGGSKLEGQITIKSESGDINLEHISGKRLVVDTTNGDINTDFDNSNQELISMRSINGDISIRTPDGGNYSMKLKAVSGDVQCELKSLQTIKTGNSWHGEIGSGEGAFEVDSIRGDIFVGLKDAEHS